MSRKLSALLIFVLSVPTYAGVISGKSAKFGTNPGVPEVAASLDVATPAPLVSASNTAPLANIDALHSGLPTPLGQNEPQAAEAQEPALLDSNSVFQRSPAPAAKKKPQPQTINAGSHLISPAPAISALKVLGSGLEHAGVGEEAEVLGKVLDGSGTKGALEAVPSGNRAGLWRRFKRGLRTSPRPPRSTSQRLDFRKKANEVIFVGGTTIFYFILYSIGAGSTVSTGVIHGMLIFFAAMIVISIIEDNLKLKGGFRFQFDMKDMMRVVTLAAFICCGIAGVRQGMLIAHKDAIGQVVRWDLRNLTKNNSVQDESDARRLVDFLLHIQILHTDIQGKREPFLLPSGLSKYNEVYLYYHGSEQSESRKWRYEQDQRGYTKYYMPAVSALTEHSQAYAPWSEQELKELYQSYSGAFDEENAGNQLTEPEFYFVAKLYRFYQGTRSSPELSQNPQELYMRYLEYMDGPKPAAIRPRLREQAKSLFDEINAPLDGRESFFSFLRGLFLLAVLYLLDTFGFGKLFSRKSSPSPSADQV